MLLRLGAEETAQRPQTSAHRRRVAINRSGWPTDTAVHARCTHAARALLISQTPLQRRAARRRRSACALLADQVGTITTGVGL